MHFRELISICQGKLLQFSADRSVQTLLIDSRKAVISEGSVFFPFPEAGTMAISSLKNFTSSGSGNL